MSNKLTEEQRLRYSIPAKKKRKSTWCTGFNITNTKKDDLHICREALFRDIPRKGKRIACKSYKE